MERYGNTSLKDEYGADKEKGARTANNSVINANETNIEGPLSPKRGSVEPLPVSMMTIPGIQSPDSNSIVPVE